MPIHDAIAYSRQGRALGRGEIPKVEYIKLLMMFWHLYTALEQALDQHATHPAIEATYNPALLSRVDALSSDISHLLQVPEDEWQSHPVHVELMANAPPALSTYLKRLAELANAPAAPLESSEENHGIHVKSANLAEDTKAKNTACVAQLLSHAYVRYLGDISGGQNVRYALGKAYNLELDSTSASGPGVSFYAFKELRSNKIANLGEMKRITTWFKDGLDIAGEKIGVESKRAIVTEAKYAFELNAALLRCINIPEPKHVDPVLCSTSPKNMIMSKFVDDIKMVAVLMLSLYALQYVWSIGLGGRSTFGQWESLNEVLS